MIKKILIGVGVLLVVLVGVVMSRPDSFRVERAQDIAAPAAIVYDQVVDFHNWAKFSPWEKLDPSMKKTFEGPNSGVGATYSWVGNDKVGEGRMTLTEGTPPSHVGINLEFIKPFSATNKTDFNIKEIDATHSNIAWVMTGNNNFASKAMSLVMDMDSMVGGDFERGLTDLKVVAEERAKAQEQAALAAAAAAAAVPPAPAVVPEAAPAAKKK